MDFPQSVFSLLQQQLAQMGRIGATRYFVTQDVTSPSPAGGQSTPVPVRFNVRGVCLAMYGQNAVTADAAAFAQCAVRVQIGGTEDMFVDGQGGATFAPMLALFGGVNNWTPLMRRVQPGVDWLFTFQNNTAAGTINPKIVLAVIADADIAKMTVGAK